MTQGVVQGPASAAPNGEIPDFVRKRSVGLDQSLGAIRRIVAMSLAFRLQAALAIVCTILAALAQLAIPPLLGRAVDLTQIALDAGSGSSVLVPVALLLLATSVTRGVLTMGQNYFAESVGHQLARQLRLLAYDRIQRLPFSLHDRVHSGDLITVGMLDLEGVRMFFSTGFIRIIHLALLIGLGAALMIATDPALGLLALSFVPFVAWRSGSSHLALRATWLDLQERLAALSQVMEENLAGIRVVRAFSAKRHEMAKFDEASKAALALSHRRVNLRVKNGSMMTYAFFLAMGLVLWFGGRQVQSGDIGIGTLASVLTFMTILQMPVRQIGMMINSIARASTCGTRVFALIDLEPAIRDIPGAPALKVTDGTLRFEDVTFAYDTAHGHPALEGIDFEARRGETIGIVGAPGSGKSSLVHLIPGSTSRSRAGSPSTARTSARSRWNRYGRR